MTVRSVPVCDTPPHVQMYMNIIRLLYVYSYNHFEGNQHQYFQDSFPELALFLTSCSRFEENTLSYKLHCTASMTLHSNASVIIQLYTLFRYLIVNTKVYNWWLYADIIRHIFRTNIFNFSILFVWINATYIRTNFFRAIL